MICQDREEFTLLRFSVSMSLFLWMSLFNKRRLQAALWSWKCNYTGLSPPACRTLCKRKMAASCAGRVARVGMLVWGKSGCGPAGSLSRTCWSRAYGTGAVPGRTPSRRAALGWAGVLGGVFGSYQVLKLAHQLQLAETQVTLQRYHPSHLWGASHTH